MKTEKNVLKLRKNQGDALSNLLVSQLLSAL